MLNINFGNYNFSQMNKTSDDISKIMISLSSGQRINSAADNPANMAIISRMQSQIDGMHMAKRNTNDGISMVNTAEHAMGTQQIILQRVRELSVRAANGVLSQSDREVINTEVQGLMEEYEHISADTSFNGHKLINGSESSILLQTGPNAGDNKQIKLSDTSASALTIDSLDLSSHSSAALAITSIDNAIDKVSDARSSMGIYKNVLDFRIKALNITSINTERSRSRIADVDYAEAISELIRNQILQQFQLAMFSQAKIASQSVLMLLR